MLNTKRVADFRSQKKSSSRTHRHGRLYPQRMQQELEELRQENKNLKLINLRQQQCIDSLNKAIEGQPKETATIEEKEAIIEDAVHSIRTTAKGLSPILSSEIPNKLDVVAFSIENMSRLATNCLDVLRITKGQSTQITVSELNIQKMLNLLQPKFALYAEEKLVSIHLELDPTVPDIVYTDSLKMFFIINNLCNNAIEHSPRNGNVTIQGSFSDSKLKIAIIDQGPGLTLEQIDRLLNQGILPHHKKDPYSPSSGIGIKSARESIKAMGGSIHIDSIPGEKTTFWFEVPVTRKG
jgi:signal transduction histidine kinase